MNHSNKYYDKETLDKLYNLFMDLEIATERELGFLISALGYNIDVFDHICWYLYAYDTERTLAEYGIDLDSI